jgi:hypothetical protein
MERKLGCSTQFVHTSFLAISLWEESLSDPQVVALKQQLDNYCIFGWHTGPYTVLVQWCTRPLSDFYSK